MNLFSHLKISTKLSISFAIIVLLTLALSVFSITQLNSLKNTIERQNDVRMEKLERLYVAREALAQTGIAARNAYIFTDEAASIHELDMVDAQKKVYLEALEQLLPHYRGDAAFEKVRLGLLKMAEELKRPRQYHDSKQQTQFGEFLVGECSPLRRQIVDDIDIVIKAAQQSVDKESQAAEAKVVWTEKILASVAAVTLLLSIAIAFLLSKSLLAQLGGDPSEVRAIADRIATGDLSGTGYARTNDESSVMHAIQEMQRSLAKIVTQVRAGTDRITNGSSQIAAGNVELSSRTVQQSSALEDTVASIEQLTATVKQNADNARQANQLAVSASEVADQGGAVVSEAVETMDAINVASKKIADIISVIDGIAFQTNILALNAAVEAARAGEQGRGFAVVAAEVRSLAQRSAGAAKEIKTLIDDSVEKVDSGTKLVGRAGSTMLEVVASIRRVTDLMGEIAAASGEQATGIEHINHAISEMDEMTQQNAALVEKASGAALSMKEQAANLTELVSVFRIAHTA